MSEPTSSVQQLVDDSVLLRVDHIPAVAAMCHRLGLIDIINDSIRWLMEYLGRKVDIDVWLAGFFLFRIQ